MSTSFTSTIAAPAGVRRTESPRVSRGPATAATGSDVADATEATDAADAALRARVLARLAASEGWQPDFSNVYVCEGQVLLQGIASTAAARRQARVLVAAIEGVRGVTDARRARPDWLSFA